MGAVGAEVDPVTDRAVSFGGRPTTTIGAHEEATSDPVDLELADSSDLAITLFFPRQTAATTSHFLALQTGYVSPSAGDFSATVHFPTVRTIRSWPFLTGVEVRTRTSSATLVVFGDSTVDGDGSTPNSNRRWPDLLSKRLRGQKAAYYFGVLNEGIIGNRLLLDSPHDSEFGSALGEAGVARFKRDALEQAGVSTVIVRIGGNDLGFPGAFAKEARPVTASALIEGYRKLIALAHAKGVRIIGTTIMPSEGVTLSADYYSPEKDSVRQQVNAWLRAQREFDGLIDCDRVLRDPAHPARLLALYDSGDHLHPNDTGDAACSDSVDLSLIQHVTFPGSRDDSIAGL
jgi:lysophospholipase L1-like esterase